MEDESSSESHHDKRKALEYQEMEERYEDEGFAGEDIAIQQVYSLQNGKGGDNKDTALGIYLGRRSMSRKVPRSYTSTFIPLLEYKFRVVVNRKNLSKTHQTKRRGGRDPKKVKPSDFAIDPDFYSQIHEHTVFGFDLKALLDALSVAESEFVIDSKNGKKVELLRLSVRSNQILRGPLITHNLDFETMYPHVLPDIRGETINDYVFADLNPEDLLDVSTHQNSNNSRRIHRRLIKDRILPCYLLPHFLSGQSHMVAVCNSALGISMDLLLGMKARSASVTDKRLPFEHATNQLCCNLKECVTQADYLNSSVKDLMLRVSHTRIMFTNFCEKLQQYDLEMYRKMMTDPNIVSSVRMTMSKPNKAQGADIPFVASTAEQRTALFFYFDEFITNFENMHGHEECQSKTPIRRMTEHFKELDSFIQYMCFGSEISFMQRDLYKLFCTFMQDVTEKRIEPERETAVPFFDELCNAYRARLKALGIRGDLLATERVVKQHIDYFEELRAEEEAGRLRQQKVEIALSKKLKKEEEAKKEEKKKKKKQQEKEVSKKRDRSVDISDDEKEHPTKKQRVSKESSAVLNAKISIETKDKMVIAEEDGFDI